MLTMTLYIRNYYELDSFIMNYFQTSFLNQLENQENAHFWQKLRDIISEIYITPEEIIHPDYEPAIIPKHYQEHLKQISSGDRDRASPLHRRDRYLTSKLKKYLYDICSGNLQLKQNSGFQGANLNLDTQQQMTNYASKWSETKFYRQLIQHNHSQGYEDRDWLVVKQEAESWRITKDGLTLQINPQQHIVDNSQLQTGQMVSVKMPPNLVDRGFYIAIGEAGSINMCNSASDVTVVELYFNVASETALLLLDRFTEQINFLKIPFNFKIAYNETDFDRFDAVVLELKSSDLPELRPILKNIYRENQACFQPEIPFFCKAIALGLGLAEKPNCSSTEPENIGQHLCGTIAKAMMDWQEESGTNKFDYVLNHLSIAGVDFKHLYLNPNVEDIYEALFT